VCVCVFLRRIPYHRQRAQCVGGGSGGGLLRVCRSALSATMRLRRRRRPRAGAEAARTSQCLRCCGASRHVWRRRLGAALLDAVHDSSSTSALVAITAAELPILQHERSAVSTGAASTGSNLFCSLSQQRDRVSVQIAKKELEISKKVTKCVSRF